MAETILVCEQCDLLHRAVEMPPEGHLVCTRCGALLDRGRGEARFDPLALAVASLILFVLANLQPVVALDIRGQTESTTLWNAVRVLFGEGRPVVAAIVFATTLVAPALELAAICYVLLPMRLGIIPPALSPVMRVMQIVRPWGMIEVFVIGTLVALVKLAHVARVLPEAGLLSFGVLILLMAGCAATFEPMRVWRRAAAIERRALRLAIAEASGR